MSEKFLKKEYKKSREAKEYIEDYWTKRSVKFTELRKEELKSNKFDRWKKQIQAHLPKNKKLKILDVGCGSGFFSILLSKLGHEVIGIDLTKSMIELGKVLAKEEKTEITFKTMDAENLLFDNEIFDIVISRNLTWNLPNPEFAYKEWLRVLKKGGYLLNYDAEYARDYHKISENLNSNNAHNELTKNDIDKCHSIYNMLEISFQNRPAWDIQELQKLGVSYCEIDFNVGKNIYLEEDKFYISTPIFGLKVKK